MRIFPILAVLSLIGLSYVHTDGVGLFVPHAWRGPAASLQDFEWSGSLARGQAIEVKGIIGDVRAVPAAGDEVEVSAVKRPGDRGYPEDVTFEVLEHEDGVTICAVYPARSHDRPNECAHGHGGRMNTNDNDTRVSFTVRVPSHVDFIGKTVLGDVIVESLRGNASAHSVNGDVELSTDGYGEASTVNGAVRARIGTAQWPHGLEFRTVNGSITLELPEGIGAEVSASTVNGDIDTDFPLTVTGRFSNRRLRGNIGGGGPSLRLETVNGSIRLRSGG